MTILDPNVISALVDLAETAGAKIMDIYNGDFAVSEKADKSVVTAADTAAEEVILAGLASLFPNIPVIAEESVAAGRIPDVKDRFFLVDPLDGTREFISRNGEFTVNIALIIGGRPVFGVVFLPALETVYWTDGDHAAWRRDASATVRILARQAPADGASVVASRSHRDPETDAFIATLSVKEIVSAGSSLKLCRVAEGKADVYPRFGRTMEWDIAAGHAVLNAAGGSVTRSDGGPFLYGKPGWDNPPFIARGRVS